MLDNFTTRVLDAMDDEHLFINKKTGSVYKIENNYTEGALPTNPVVQTFLDVKDYMLLIGPKLNDWFGEFEGLKIDPDEDYDKLVEKIIALGKDKHFILYRIGIQKYSECNISVSIATDPKYRDLVDWDDGYLLLPSNVEIDQHTTGLLESAIEDVLNGTLTSIQTIVSDDPYADFEEACVTTNTEFDMMVDDPDWIENVWDYLQKNIPDKLESNDIHDYATAHRKVTVTYEADEK